jgi:hypothetical protein
MRFCACLLILPVALLWSASLPSQQAWAPVPGKLQTKWASDVSPLDVWPEYPRPGMRRANWQSLNGLWDYAILPAAAPRPVKADGQILVPFALESALSGVGKSLAADQRLWYRRKFTLQKPADQCVLLHFDAVDWECEAWLDGTRLGEHRGGYDRFSFDVTRALGPGIEHVLLVAVRGPSDQGPQPRGRQVQKLGGSWNTPSSGIWQTVWCEMVPSIYLRSVGLKTKGDGFQATVEISGRATFSVRVAVLDAGRTIATATGRLRDSTVECVVPEARRWRPFSPYRYELVVTLLDAAAGEIDRVHCWLAFRDLTVGKDANGLTRLLIDGAPVFQFGQLDPGYWPDGGYTPPSFAAMCGDLDTITALGCNLLRKQVKVESELFYDECDRRGLLVWQGMPFCDPQQDPANFERELHALIEGHRNHPSIVMWVPFHAGWGQHDTEHYVKLIRQWDPMRWVCNASGCSDHACGDVIDLQVYPGPHMLPVPDRRASVLGEFLGLGLPTAGRTFVDKGNPGQVSKQDQAARTEAYLQAIAALHPLIAQGLSAAVYTQATDGESAINGLVTYDRAVQKIDVPSAALAAQTLYQPHGVLLPVVPTAMQAPQAWRWTVNAPPVGWQQASFDDAGWTEGVSGFGKNGTPGAHIGTDWQTESIWLRRQIVLPDRPLAGLQWCLHHDADLMVYLDGILVLARQGPTTGYEYLPTDRATVARCLPGVHMLAVQCRQAGGGQYVDLGMSLVDWPVPDVVPSRTQSTGK